MIRMSVIPQVSVIIPIYGVKDYICQCIDSVLYQSFTDYELILVDDGSTDGSGKICDEYIKRNNRVTVIHKKNGGLSDARNTGLLFAKGKYIYFLDGDDWIDINLLNRAVGLIREGYDLIVFNSYLSYPEKTIEMKKNQTGLFEIKDDFSRSEFFIGTLLVSKIGWSSSDRLFSRSILEKNNITFADNQKIFLEDLFFSCCYCAHASKILSIEDRLFYYRQRQGSIMHSDGLNVNFNRMNELTKELYGYYCSRESCKELVNIFPQIYYFIIFNYILSLRDSMTMSELRKAMMEEIDDNSFMLKQLKDIKIQKFIFR